MATAITLTHKRVFFDLISLKIVLYVAVGAELVLQAIGLITALWNSHNGYSSYWTVILQLIEVGICVCVFYAVQENGRPNFLLIYLAFNIVEIAYMELVAFPNELKMLLDMELRNMQGSILSVFKHNETVGYKATEWVIDSFAQHGSAFEEDVNFHTFSSFGYLLIAGGCWYVVYLTYKELKKNPVGRQFAHQRFDNGGPDSVPSVPSTNGNKSTSITTAGSTLNLVDDENGDRESD